MSSLNYFGMFKLYVVTYFVKKNIVRVTIIFTFPNQQYMLERLNDFGSNYEGGSSLFKAAQLNSKRELCHHTQRIITALKRIWWPLLCFVKDIHTSDLPLMEESILDAIQRLRFVGS